MLRVAQVSVKIAILSLLLCRTAWADVAGGGGGSGGCAATSPSSLVPFVMLSVVLLHLRRRGRSILEAPKSRVVSRVFVAWPFDGASIDASANDAIIEPPVEAQLVLAPQRDPDVTAHAIADLTAMVGPANDFEGPAVNPRHAERVAAYLRNSGVPDVDRRAARLAAVTRTQALQRYSDDVIKPRRGSTHTEPGARGHVFDVATDEPTDLRD